jgi:hypothetical protein
MIINESFDLTPLCFQSLTDLSNEYPVPTIVILTNKMNPFSISNFKLDSFEFNGLYNCLSISIEKFERGEVFNLISENFLKKKKINHWFWISTDKKNFTKFKSKFLSNCCFFI